MDESYFSRFPFPIPNSTPNFSIEMPLHFSPHPPYTHVCFPRSDSLLRQSANHPHILCMPPHSLPPLPGFSAPAPASLTIPYSTNALETSTNPSAHLCSPLFLSLLLESIIFYAGWRLGAIVAIPPLPLPLEHARACVEVAQAANARRRTTP